MPTNLPAEAEAAYQRYLEAKTIEEKIRALEDYISKVPKHKGTEKLLKQAKQTLTKLKLELERKREISKKQTYTPFAVSKEEDIMIVLLGLPGVGKTTLFNYLTGAGVEIKATINPNIGIMDYERVPIQVVDLPPIYSDNLDKTPNGRAIMGVARNSDLIALVIDLTQDVFWQLNTLLSALKNAYIIVDRDPPPIRFEKLSKGGIQISGVDYTPYTIEEIKEIIKSAGISNCILEFYGPVDHEDIEYALNRRVIYKKALIIATKGDLKGTKKTLEILMKNVNKFRVIPTSAILKVGKDLLGKAILEELDVIRIWTKKRGMIADKPMIMPKGATIRDVAEKIHTEFIERFKFAVVERKGSKIKKIRAGLSFALEDGDVVTIYVGE